MKKIIRLTESDLTRIVKQAIREYAPYEKSIDDLEKDFERKHRFFGLSDEDVDELIDRRHALDKPGSQLWAPETEDEFKDEFGYDYSAYKNHQDKINKLTTYYKEKIIYDFLQNINLTSEENEKLEFLDEKLSNPNLGSDKIERYKNLKNQLYLGHLNKYLNSLDKKYFGQYFISNNYNYFKDKIKDFAYNNNFPSKPVPPTSSEEPNFLQRTAKKVKNYFGLSENRRLTESDLTRIVKLVIAESEQTEKTPEYTVQSGEIILKGVKNKGTSDVDLKIFQGTKFVKEGKKMVANTKYQFTDSFGNVVIGVGATPKMRSGKTYTGKVTYGCDTGRFTVNIRTDLNFYAGDFQARAVSLAKELQKNCKIKVDDNPVVGSHPCDLNKQGTRIAKGKSFDYCFNQDKYYFKGTKGDYLTKYKDWTEASGTGLEAIKSKIFPDIGA